MKRRATVLVCDGLGVGEAPDSGKYGDAGSNTLGHVLERAAPDLPNLASLGLLCVAGGSGAAMRGASGRMKEISAGKDSTTGHWEMMGLATAHPFPTYPDGFPAEVITEIERAIGRKTLGNVPASGTRILEDLGAEHLATGRPIVYTSADSVLQIAAHESIVPAEKLWEMCRASRRMSQEYSASDEDGIRRTVARLKETDDDFVFTNLVDFDSKYGHRNDVSGFAENLRRLDGAIPDLLACLRGGDLFFLTGDHGCDPSDSSTDHTRELVPLLVVGPGVRAGADLGVRESFRDLAATLEDWFGMPPGSGGRSALPEIFS